MSETINALMAEQSEYGRRKAEFARKQQGGDRQKKDENAGL